MEAGAQTVSGQITGVLKDSSGAVLPGVSMTAKNVATGFTRTTLTNESGVYAMPSIPIGNYEVTAELPGFQKQIRSGITLNVDDNLRIDFTLTVGQASESVTVTGEVTAIQTESAAVATAVTNRTVLETPLNGRVFFDLVELVPGAVTPAPNNSLANRGGISIAGSREGENTYTIDGIDNGSSGTNGPQIKLGIETLQEFKVLTNSYSPEYGRSSGGNVVMTTRSGTNEFRGTVWEFVRNASLLDAKNLFDPPYCDRVSPGTFCTNIPPLHQNQFGAVLGGPVPKMKNLFFFTSYEGLRSAKSLSSLATVPTAAMHNGDFSSLLPKTVIKDPLTGQPFQNNIILQQRWDPVGKAFLDLYQMPNSSGASNLLSNPIAGHYNDQATGRLDYNFGKNNFFVRHIWNRELIREPFPGRGVTQGNPGFGWDNPLVGNALSTGAALVFSPRVIGNLRYGINHIVEYLTVGNLTPFAQQAGLVGASTLPVNYGRPSISATNYTAVGDYSSAPGLRNEWNHEWNYTQNILLGNHALTAGFNFRLVHIDHGLPNQRRGSFSFDGSWSGNSVADMLLGYARTSSLTPDSANWKTHQRGKNPAWFFNDDWKITPKLTLNAGVRYEFSTPMTDADDAIASFDFATGKVIVPDLKKLPPVDPVTGLVGGVLNGNLIEQSTFGAGLRAPDYRDIEPRFGIAYTLNSKTVIRSGYGVFFEVLTYGNSQISFVQNSPWFPTKTFSTDSTTGPVITLSQNPFPNKLFTAPLLTTNGWDPNFRDGYVQNWNLTVQHELRPNLLLDLGYVGSHAVKLFTSYNQNQSFLVGGPLGSGSQQSRKLYPQFSSVNEASSIGRAGFNSMQLKLERRFAAGFSILGSYMWSKNMTSGNAQNIHIGNTQEWGLSPDDARHRLTTNYLYGIPLGRGHKFFSNGPLQQVFGDWQWSGILTMQSGRPFTPSLSGDISNTGSSVRPNLIGDPNSGPKTAGQFWNAAAFALPAANTFGNAGIGVLTGPGMRTFDSSLTKNFQLGSDEKRRLQFRGEVFNLFNHPVWGVPGTTVNGPTFGQVTGTLVNTTSRQIQLALKLYF
jgi:hypothetical protein